MRAVEEAAKKEKFSIDHDRWSATIRLRPACTRIPGRLVQKCLAFWREENLGRRAWCSLALRNPQTNVNVDHCGSLWF